MSINGTPEERTFIYYPNEHEKNLKNDLIGPLTKLEWPTDYLIIALIVVLLISMSLCCICMLCKKDQQQENRNIDDLPPLHDVEEPLNNDTVCEYADMRELVKPGTPPPLYRSLVQDEEKKSVSSSSSSESSSLTVTTKKTRESI